MNRQKNGYRNLLVLGRNLKAGAKYEPEEIIAAISLIEEQLLWTPVEDFFRLFPPIKRYADDGTWDYKSTLKMIEEDLGERFGKGDFLNLLMMGCYENPFVNRVGIAFMKATSELYRKKTGKSLLEEAMKHLFLR